jgi:hypothetical protein
VEAISERNGQFQIIYYAQADNVKKYSTIVNNIK